MPSPSMGSRRGNHSKIFPIERRKILSKNYRNALFFAVLPCDFCRNIISIRRYLCIWWSRHIVIIGKNNHYPRFLFLIIRHCISSCLGRPNLAMSFFITVLILPKFILSVKFFSPSIRLRPYENLHYRLLVLIRHRYVDMSILSSFFRALGPRKLFFRKKKPNNYVKSDLCTNHIHLPGAIIDNKRKKKKKTAIH